MKLIHMTGDIFTTTSSAIGHGVNTSGVMGAGIAKLFQDKFPQNYTSYREACHSGALQPGGMHPYEQFPRRFIYNIASQDKPGPNARIEWLSSGVALALNHARDNQINRIALPRIGSGIGGLDETHVEQWLNYLAVNSAVDIELWTLPKKLER